MVEQPEALLRRYEEARAKHLAARKAEAEALDALRALKKPRDEEVEQARRRAVEEWEGAVPRPRRPWLARRWRWWWTRTRLYRWQQGRAGHCAAACADAVEQYRLDFEHAHGADYEQALEQARVVHNRAVTRRRVADSADRQVTQEIIRLLHREHRWTPREINDALPNQTEHGVKKVLGLLPRPTSRSRDPRHAGGGGSWDGSHDGGAANCGGGGGGGD
ncbi:hypothetical protein [Amycolatopsis magusensis]|uniref:hypothetical protein n=1 Tax=Amycolatopsis magusensis TaxID=882444 RepID=UPI0037B743EA